jgi:hypothetical protein
MMHDIVVGLLDGCRKLGSYLVAGLDGAMYVGSRLAPGVTLISFSLLKCSLSKDTGRPCEDSKMFLSAWSCQSGKSRPAKQSTNTQIQLDGLSDDECFKAVELVAIILLLVRGISDRFNQDRPFFCNIIGWSPRPIY